MKLVVSTSILPQEMVTEEGLKLLRDGGIDHIEMAIVRHRVNYDDPAYVERLVTWVKELEVSVPLGHAPLGSPLLPHQVDLSNLDEELRRWSLEEVKKGARILARLGGKVLVVHAGTRLVEGEDPTARVLQARKSVEELVSFCWPMGIQLAMENLLPGAVTSGAERVREFVEGFDGDRVGICLDIGHANIGEDPVGALEIVKDRLFTFHIADNHGVTDEHIMPMKGTLDWPSFMRALARAGYAGWFTYEVLGVADVQQSLVEVHRTFRQLCRFMGEGMEGRAGRDMLQANRTVNRLL